MVTVLFTTFHILAYFYIESNKNEIYFLKHDDSWLGRIIHLTFISTLTVTCKKENYKFLMYTHIMLAPDKKIIWKINLIWYKVRKNVNKLVFIR